MTRRVSELCGLAAREGIVLNLVLRFIPPATQAVETPPANTVCAGLSSGGPPKATSKGFEKRCNFRRQLDDLKFKIQTSPRGTLALPLHLIGGRMNPDKSSPRRKTGRSCGFGVVQGLRYGTHIACTFNPL